MSLGSMRQELLGIPGANFGLVTTKINEALAAVQNENVFSFQLQTGGWLTPGLLSGLSNLPVGYGQGPYGQGAYGGTLGTTVPTPNFLSPGLITVTPFSTTITGDPIATAAWTANTPYPPFLTQQQIRVPYYSLYNIIALGNNGTVAYLSVMLPGSGQTPGLYAVNATSAPGDPGFGAMAYITVDPDGTVTKAPVILNPGSGYLYPPQFNLAAGGIPAAFQTTMIATLTLDRPWMEPPQVNAGYMIYQAYFPAPPGFKRWYNIRDTTNNAYIDWWSYDQRNLAEFDAQRVQFLQPSHCVAYGMDTRQGSATYGQMLYELWPHPIMRLPYTFGCQANWPALVNPSDTLPYPLTDELIKMRSYEMLYLWKESQKGDEMERGSGANWQFLSQAMRAEYSDRLKTIRNMDRNLVDLYFTKMRRTVPTAGQVYGTVTGQASVGGWDS